MPAVVAREAQLRALQARVIKAEREALRARRDRIEADQRASAARDDLVQQITEAMTLLDDKRRAELIAHLAAGSEPQSKAA